MKVLLQRVSQASVSVDGEVVSAIDKGLLLLVGLERHDTSDQVARMAAKVLGYRVFADDQGKMNLSVRDLGAGILVISQFTLAADTQKGLRPGFSVAASPQQAETLYQHFVAQLQQQHQPVATGIFAADMQVALVNDGPVTFLLSA